MGAGGGATVISRSTADRAEVRERDRARRRHCGMSVLQHVLPIGQVDDRRFTVDAPVYWSEYTYGYGSVAVVAAAVIGSGINGCTITLPQCRQRPREYAQYVGKLRSYELESLYAFGHEIHASSFATILRTAAVIGFGLAYGRDGVVNGRAKVSCAYVETLLVLSGRCNDELFDRVGKPLLSVLLKAYREGSFEAVRDIACSTLDWYSPRYLDNLVRTLDWYEQFIIDEINGRVDRRTMRRVG